MTLFQITLAGLSLSGMVLAGVADATPRDGWQPVAQMQPVGAGGELSRDQAVALVQKRYHARVVRADTEQDGDQRYYVIRLLSEDGKVWTVRVDARSGQIR